MNVKESGCHLCVRTPVTDVSSPYSFGIWGGCLKGGKGELVLTITLRNP